MLSEIDKILEIYKKKAEPKICDAGISSSGEHSVNLCNTYLLRKPGLVKGLQREKVPSEISVNQNEDDEGEIEVEISFGKDDKSEELAAIFMASVREISEKPDEVMQREVSLEAIASAELRTASLNLSSLRQVKGALNVVSG